MSLDLRLDYKGAVSDPENIKKDLKKAMRISILSVLTASAVTVGLYFLAEYIQMFIS